MLATASVSRESERRFRVCNEDFPLAPVYSHQTWFKPSIMVCEHTERVIEREKQDFSGTAA